MKTNAKLLGFSLVLALVLIGGALGMLGIGDDTAPVLAQGPDGYDVYHVALDCTGVTAPCYTTVQEAVDAVDDPADEVWVAAGTYTGVNGYGGLSQLVYISKSLTLRGGYSTNFAFQDPTLYTTTLNAQDDGRVLYINGSGITVTVEGLDIYGGYVSGAGGGVYIAQVTVTITDCLIRRNGYDDWEVYSSEGGGVYVNAGATIRLENNTFYRNWAHSGGGIYIKDTSDAMVVGNDINSNRARHNPGRGGGVYAQHSPGITLIDNDIHDNQALPDELSEGGGVYLRYSDHAVLQDNRFYDNHVEVAQPGNITSLGGGGFYVGGSDHVLVTGNEIYSNTVHGERSRGWPYGGGALIKVGTSITFTHNLVHHNAADGVVNSHGDCGGLALEDVSDSFVAHNEIYANTATDRWGGVVLYGDRFTFIGNQVYDNEAQEGHAGGVFLGGGDRSLVRDNEIYHNTVSGIRDDYYGGGLYVSGSNTNTLESNLIYANTAAYAGGGIQISGSGHTLIGNRIFSNTASYGGGIRVSADNTTLVNNVLAYNEATGAASGDDGSGAAFKGDNTHWYHTTVVGNIGSGSGLYAFSGGTGFFTNTLIYSQTTGMRNNGGAVTMTLTLWDQVPTQTLGGINTFGDITGTAALDADGYHLTASSDAIGEGISTDVDSDVDGQPRSMGNAPDLGADEYAFSSDLALDKTGPASGSAGKMLTYTLTLTNPAASEVDTDARVVDAVEPASAVLALSAYAPGAPCTGSGAGVTCTVTNITTDTVRTVTVWVTPTATYDGVLTNTAGVAPLNAIDPEGVNDTDVVTTHVTYVPPVPELWVEKEVSAQYAEPGDTLVYTVTWGNRGMVPASSVTLSDTLPAEVFFVAASPSQDGGPNPLVWHVGDVAAGTAETYVITASVNSGLVDGTVLTNTVDIAAPTLSDTAVVTTIVYEQAAGMEAIKRVGLTEASPGDLLEYTILITNSGPIPIQPTLADPRPEGTELQLGWTATRGTLDYDHDLEAFTWSDTEPLQPGEGVELHFTFKVVACEGYQCGLVRNIVSISEPTYPYLSRDLQADTVIQCPDMVVDVDADDIVTYRAQYDDLKTYQATVAYENKDHGDHSMTATAKLTLTLPEPPEGAWFESAHPTPTTKLNGHQWVWVFPDLAPGDGSTIAVTVGPEYWLDKGYTLDAAISALPRDADHPALECSAHQGDNAAYDTTYPAGLEMNKKVGSNRWLVFTDPHTAGEVHHQYQLEYFATYGYRSAVPTRPPVTTFGLVDHFPEALTLDTQLSQPKLADNALPENTLMWEATGPVQAGDTGWLRMRGVTDSITPGHRLTNTLHGSAQGEGFTFEREDQASAAVPLFPPLITFPENGEACSGPIEVRGVAPIGTQVSIQVDLTQVAVVDVDDDGTFTATVAIDTLLPTEIRAKALHPTALFVESDWSSEVELTAPVGGHWCPQRSHWDGTVKAGALKGQEVSLQFRDAGGKLSTQDWQMPGVYGFWDTDLHLYSCCNEQTQAMTVTADGEVYAPSSRDGHWYHFDIAGGAHGVVIESQCGDEMKTSSGEILIDPDGFVFNVDEGGDYDATTGIFDPVQAISGVTVTCMVSRPQWGGWVPWPAHLYEDQVNPQVTDDIYPDGITTTGYYAFFTPPGHYYLQVEGIDGYQAWRSPVVEVITEIVHVNVSYTPWAEDVAKTVTLTPDGPDPAVITVPVGSTIEWISALRASDTISNLIAWSENPILHPRSDLDPLEDTRGFDAGFLEPGRTYRRTFSSPGTYAYTGAGGHQGTVVVKNRKLYLPLVMKH